MNSFEEKAFLADGEEWRLLYCGKRLQNVHFKDMADNEKKSICACGRGVLDFSAIAALCKQEGVVNVLVEQDNAPDAADALDEMKFSYEHLRPILDAVQ